MIIVVINMVNLIQMMILCVKKLKIAMKMAKSVTTQKKLIRRVVQEEVVKNKAMELRNVRSAQTTGRDAIGTEGCVVMVWRATLEVIAP